jgi:hypothetical protein
MTARALVLPALLAGALLAGCGAGAEEDERPAAPAPAAATRLTIEVTRARPEPIRMELRCGASAPCDARQLARLRRTLAGAREPDRTCTLVYGGPERARVSGSLQGRPVDVTLTRSNGCGIADYDDLFGALGRTPPLAG